MKIANAIVVRHGETEWNVSGKIMGQLDSPLTALGLKQAEALADGLAGLGIRALYCSDLGRARQTAEAINRKLKLPVAFDARLREQLLGVMQGHTRQEFAKLYPAECEAFASADPEYRIPGGESTRDHYERAVACVQEIADLQAGETVLIVTHGWTLRCLLRRTLGLPLNDSLLRFSMFNASINGIAISGELWRLNTWGCISHLKGLGALDEHLSGPFIPRAAPDKRR